MMTMKELFLKIEADTDLQDTFKKIMEEAAHDVNVAGKRIAQFAKEQGFDVTVEEILESFNSDAAAFGSQISDEEIDSVAGGLSWGALFSTMGQLCDGSGINSAISWQQLACARR